ncbi:Uncharacterized protein conserved in bacteria [Moraxella caprae]|uniref:Uncharacterized protein conserved in bacteria n=1 Tax=Moraxella caprae TaxID=90240 RepID=A0A378R1G7_9GAMM|nr:DUF1778 domain-containing protein [Moraxella caprae]STZ09166.1 Uncharacterized protein conserved in bacteria [Moraxella caprae]
MTAQTQLTQTARFEARVPKHVHDTIKLASQMTGRTMSDFVMSIAYEHAQNALKRHDETMEILRLSKEDSRQVAQNLINPPPMNEAMRRAKAEYEAFVQESKS